MGVLVDLQHQNEGCAAQYYDVPGQNVLISIHQNAQLCMKDDMGTLVTWLHLRISAHDMINQVMQRCPTNTPIPTEVLVNLEKPMGKGFCTLPYSAKF